MTLLQSRLSLVNEFLRMLGELHWAGRSVNLKERAIKAFGKRRTLERVLEPFSGKNKRYLPDVYSRVFSKSKRIFEDIY